MVPTSSKKPLEEIVSTLDRQIGVVERAGLSVAALSLKMAKMEIQLKLNDITDDEFDAFVDIIARRHLNRVEIG